MTPWEALADLLADIAISADSLTEHGERLREMNRDNLPVEIRYHVARIKEVFPTLKREALASSIDDLLVRIDGG